MFMHKLYFRVWISVQASGEGKEDEVEMRQERAVVEDADKKVEGKR